MDKQYTVVNVIGYIITYKYWKSYLPPLKRVYFILQIKEILIIIKQYNALYTYLFVFLLHQCICNKAGEGKNFGRNNSKHKKNTKSLKE